MVKRATSRLKSALCHSSIVVRDVVLDVLASSFPEDRDATQEAIRSIERYGWSGFAFWPDHFASLPLNHETLPWVVEQIRRSDRGRSGDAICEPLRRMVTNIPLEMIANRGTWLMNNVPFEPSERERIAARFDLVGVAPERCWRQLVKFCKTLAGGETAGTADLEHARLLLEPIARAGCNFHSRVLEILSRDGIAEDDALAWLTGFMLTLAGEMRLEEAIELIHGKFRFDREWYSEESLNALARIGSPQVMSVLREGYGSEPWCVRNYVVGVLANVHSEQAVRTIITLIAEEEDDFLRGQLGCALARQLDAATADLASELYWESPEDLNRDEIRSALVASSYLGDYAFPERDRWEAEIVAEHQDYQRQTTRC